MDPVSTTNKQNIFPSDEYYLNTLLENSPDNIYFKDLESRFTRVSKSFAERNRLTPEEMIGKTDFDIFHNIHAKEAFDDELEIIKTGTPLLGKEEREDWLNGTTTWVSTSKMPLYNQDKEIIGTFGISRDITDQKNNEKEVTKIVMFEKTLSKVSTIFLRHGSEKFLAALPIVLRELSSMFQADKSYVFFCEKNENDFVKAEEFHINPKDNSDQFDINNFNYWHQTMLAQQSVFDFKGNLNSYIGQEELLYLRKRGLSHIIIVPIINNTSLTGFIVFECKNKISIWLYKYKSLFKILSEILSYTYSNYLSEKSRLEAEDELLTLMRAVNQSHSIIIIMDNAGAIEFVNPRFSELTGLAYDEVLGTIPHFLKPEMNKKFNNELFWQTMESGKTWEDKFQETDKSGKAFWESITISPIKNYRNNVTNLIAIVEDITEKMMLENRKAISQKLESIGQLAAGIAHEINTPMQYIGDNTKFLKDTLSSLTGYLMALRKASKEFSSAISPEFKEKIEQLKAEYDIDYIMEELPRSIEQTESGIARVTNLIKAMKDFAHPGVKEKSFNNINNGIKVTAEISKNEWKYVADLKLNLSESLPPVFCLIDEINQVILNMIINSAHAIEEKNGSKNSGKGEIVIETYRENDLAVITITDSGAGIKDSIVDKIFDPFFTTKEVGKGTGQGLAIAHDLIVNKHNGSITVDSKYGAGTKFIIKIPIDLKGKNNNE